MFRTRACPTTNPAAERLDFSLLVEQFTSQAKRILEILDMFNRYAAAGGRDWASYERIFDHSSREGMKLVQYSHSALDPEQQERAQRAVAAAADRTPGPTGQRGAIHQKMASSVLATVYYARWHHLLEVEDWPDKLALAPCCARASCRTGRRKDGLCSPGCLTVGLCRDKAKNRK